MFLFRASASVCGNEKCIIPPSRGGKRLHEDANPAVKKHVHTVGGITFISEGKTRSAEILSAFVSSAGYWKHTQQTPLNGTTSFVWD